MTVTQAEAQSLAAFIVRIRDDWDHPGVVAAIRKASALGSAADIGVALCRLAGNRELRTPATLADPGPHWRDTTVGKRDLPAMCPEHPAEKAGHCRECVSRAVQPTGAVRAALADAKAAVRANRPTAPRRAPEPAPRDTARADHLRALIDQEESE